MYIQFDLLPNLFNANLNTPNWLLCAMQERTLAEAENRPAPPQCCSGDVRSLKFSDFKHAHEQVKCYGHLHYLILSFILSYNLCSWSECVANMTGLVFRFVRVYHRIQTIWMSSSNGTTSTEKAGRGRRHRWATLCSLNNALDELYIQKQPRR